MTLHTWFYVHTRRFYKCSCVYYLSAVIRDYDLYLLVQSHRRSTFQDTWLTLNLTNYSEMVCYSNLACIRTDILYPRPSGH